MDFALPKGFEFAGVHCGLKSDPAKYDISLIASRCPAVAAGVYTQNVVRAASVFWNEAITPSKNVRAIVANSGNANACTGQQGIQDNQSMAEQVASRLAIDPQQVLVLSTGIIGELMKMDLVSHGIDAAAERLGETDTDFLGAAEGIMTTDQFNKIAGGALASGAGGAEIRICAMAKGAGMIGPKMATLLAVVATDAHLTPEDAQTVLADVADHSFNCISVEGHTSTNDTLLLLANGQAGGEPLTGSALIAFRDKLLEICIDLARKIPSDGEGSSHLITIDVKGCASQTDARRIAETIANSALVKTAVTGADPNWGRIVSAAGYAGVPFDVTGVSLAINDMSLFEKGAPLDFDPVAASSSISDQHETRIVLELSEGDAEATFWTCDLTEEYLRFNSEYHT